MMERELVMEYPGTGESFIYDDIAVAVEDEMSCICSLGSGHKIVYRDEIIENNIELGFNDMYELINDSMNEIDYRMDLIDRQEEVCCDIEEINS